MYLVIGANGFLGSYFLKNLLTETKEKIIATARNLQQVCMEDSRIEWVNLDVEEFQEIDCFADRFAKEKASLKVIYLAAYHHPDMVERNPRKAWNVNVTSLSYFLNRMPSMEYFVYPSTDTVYGEGTLEYRFKEDSALKPANRYGRQKIVAETLVTSYGHHVVRYPFLIAPSLLKHKKHFYDMILEKISAHEPMEMFSDSYRSSLDFDTVARLTIRLMEKGTECVPAVLNVSGDEALSKYDVGLMIAKKYHIDTGLIVPVSMQSKNGIFEVPRAAATILDNTLLKKTLGIDAVRLHI